MRKAGASSLGNGPSCRLESLERRTLMSAAASAALAKDLQTTFAQPDLVVNENVVEPAKVTPNALPAGFSPQEIRKAYGFDEAEITRHGKTYIASGFGETIAIIDAYDDTSISSDAKTFDSTFGLSDDTTGNTFFLETAQPDGIDNHANQSDAAGWAGETSLDVEWAHAIAPRATVLLVQAYDDSLNSLIDAVNYARDTFGVVAVSMSWGSTEFQYETQLDQYLETPLGHKGGYNEQGGITFTSSAGDSGSGASWPAASPNVLAVGGTDLYTTANGTYSHETAWNGSGGGFSEIEGTNAPDVAYDADPNTGFAVYDSVPYQGMSGWAEYGGTSAGAPQWAALIADADQGRYYRNEPSLNGPSLTLPYIDDENISSDPIARNYFHDVTTGSNGGFNASVGYDLVTGWGSPKAQKIIPALLKV